MARNRTSSSSVASESANTDTPPSSSQKSLSSSNSISSRKKGRKSFLDKLLHRKNSTSNGTAQNSSTLTSENSSQNVWDYQEILSESEDEDEHANVNSTSTISNGYFSDNETSDLNEMKPLKLKKLLPSGGLLLEDDLEKLLINPKYVKVLRKSTNSPKSLRRMFLAQELNAHSSASSSDQSQNLNQREIFTMKFSHDGKYLATAGRDSVINIWKVVSSPLDRLEYEANNSHHHTHSHDTYPLSPTHSNSSMESNNQHTSVYAPVFHDLPFRVFKDHSDGVLSLDWSKNNFLISGSMDKTAKLWHVDRQTCLKTFKHSDFVTTVNFHPTDDRFFLSGSLDNNMRLWSILDKEIAYQADTGSLITAAALSPNGDTCLVGGFNGKCFIYDTKGLELKGSFEIKGSKHLKSVDTKVTGIQVVDVGEKTDLAMRSKQGYKEPRYRALITTNDSNVRLLDSATKKLVTKFKGVSNSSSSIMGSFSDDQRYVIAGSENHWVYVWKNDGEAINQKVRDYLSKNDVGHIGIDTEKRKNKIQRRISLSKRDHLATENKGCSFFHAHHTAVNCAIFAPIATKKLLELSDDPIYDLLKHEDILSDKSIASVVNTHPLFRSLKNSGSKLHELTGKINLGEHFNNSQEDCNIKEGFIIVTTDRTGLIRVFRQDSGFYIRKSIVESNQDILKKIVHNAQTHNKAGELNPAINDKLKKFTNQRSMSPSSFPNRHRSKSLRSNFEPGLSTPKKLTFLNRNGSSQTLHNMGYRHDDNQNGYTHSNLNTTSISSSPTSPRTVMTNGKSTNATPVNAVQPTHSFQPVPLISTDSSSSLSSPVKRNSIKRLKDKVKSKSGPIPIIIMNGEVANDESRGRSKWNDFEV